MFSNIRCLGKSLFHVIILKNFHGDHITIGDKIVETMSVNKTIHTPLLSHSKLGCLLFSTGSLNSGTTWHGGGGGGVQQGKLYFPFWSWQEALKGKVYH